MKITKKNLMNMIKAQLEEVLSDDDRFRDLPGYEEYTDGEKLKRRRKKKPADDIPDERWREDDPIFRSHLEEEKLEENVMKISKNKLKNMIKEELEEAMAQPSLRDVANSIQAAAATLVTGKVLEVLQSSGNME